MTLNYDLHLFYDQQDNTKKGEEDIGWAENFIRFLRIMLRQFMGRDPVFTQINPEEADVHILSQVKTVIFIISPLSVNSDALQKTIGDFRSQCDSQAGTGVTFASRIFKIVKFPVPLSDQPQDIRALLPFDLYDYDPASGKTKEINNFFSQEAEMNYWMKLVDLAFDINETIGRIDKQMVSGLSAAVKRSVFLAETGPELIVQRNMIKRELLRQGYQVHPDKNLPEEPNKLSEEVKDILNNCNYSIHLMGDHATSGRGATVAEVQNSAVSSFIKSNPDKKAEGFSRLIWLSPNFKIKDERQQAFLENMRRDLEDVGHTEIFQTPFEDFKFVLKNTLIDVSDFNMKIGTANGSAAGKSVYLIYDKADKERAGDFAGYLKRKGMMVLEPSFEGNLLDIRQLHIQNLIEFDAVVIFAGQVNAFWVKMKLLDILKSPGFGRMKPLMHKSILIDVPGKIDKDEFRNYEIAMIERTGDGFDFTDEFINNIQ
ncbi:MAG TPA: hypothetical protein VI583_13690 [Cyclobacteriaceae bacterium]|nr:hypothetical protein [Cyclobacteriaceae bacterium]